MVAIHYLKKDHVMCQVHTVIQYKLGDREVGHPIVVLGQRVEDAI